MRQRQSECDDMEQKKEKKQKTRNLAESQLYKRTSRPPPPSPTSSYYGIGLNANGTECENMTIINRNKNVDYKINKEKLKWLGSK